MNVLWLAPHPIPEVANMHPAPWITSLGTRLSEKGVGITVVTTAKRLQKDVVEYEMNGYKLIILNTPSGYIDLATLFKKRLGILNRFLTSKIGKYDLIHIHGTEYQFASSVISLKNKIPCIISLQGIIYKYKKHIKDFLTIRRIMWELGSLYERNELRRFDYFFCRTHWDTSCVQENNIKAQVFKVWEMLRPEFYVFEKRKMGTNILFSGGDNTLKGLECCLRVFDKLLVLFPDLKLHIIRDCNVKLIRKIVQKFGLRIIVETSIIRHGTIGVKEILNLYLDCFCFYHPALIDNSPNSVCEAQLAGLPVIANDVGGVSSIIQHRETGLLVQPNDIEGHYKAILELKEDKRFQEYLIESSRQMALKRHDPDTIVNQTLEVYNRVVLKN